MQTILNFNPISAIALTLPDFHDLKKGDVLVSPSGNIFSFGETVQEFVPSGHESDNSESTKEYHFIDEYDSLRKIVFEDGISMYGLVIGSNGKVQYTSGLQKKIGKEYDQDWNEYVEDELGWVD